MSKEINIDDALKRLNTGKFSFQMSDCIANHIAEQSRQIVALTTLNDQRRSDIMQHELHIHLLEREVSKLKTLLLGSLMPRTLLSQAIETASGTKEKLQTIDATAAGFWIAEIKTRLLALGKSFGPAGENGLKFVQPQIREAIKSFEKFTSDLFSKIKAA
jgi:hypothetical protein